MSTSQTGSGQPKYRRIVLKLSGEALREPGSTETISPDIVAGIAKQLQQVRDLGVEVAVVIGGGQHLARIDRQPSGYGSYHCRLYGDVGHNDQWDGFAEFAGAVGSADPATNRDCD